MTSLLTTALEEMTINNEQLRREVDLLKVDNIQLRANVDTMRDEIGRLRTENQQLKVSQLSGIT